MLWWLVVLVVLVLVLLLLMVVVVVSVVLVTYIDTSLTHLSKRGDAPHLLDAVVPAVVPVVVPAVVKAAVVPAGVEGADSDDDDIFASAAARWFIKISKVQFLTLTATLPIYSISHRTLYSRLLPPFARSF